ncbi:hypothetical protein [Hyphomonas sp.]|uniref:hypothetical protein n=1 Tax=Hyphomonas sp. TaxID=87 RepID=UPI00391B90A8
MSGFWLFMTVALIVWAVAGRSRCRPRRYAGYPEADVRGARDTEIDRLNERIRVLEEIITDRDWRLRRDIDRL